jgi:DNA-binding PadR family transcriptional regulator
MNRNPHLPLTETTFYILLVLTKPAHGYAVIQEIDRLSKGQVKVAAGTMYGAIENLMKLNWIEEVPSQDKRRRVYQITELGKDTLLAESKRLRELVNLSNEFGFKGGEEFEKV